MNLQSMHSFLKEVGRGKKGARDLTYSESSDVAALILSGNATDAQIGAFLQAERIKEESSEELFAFIQECRRRSQLIEHGFHDVLDTTGPYDGRSKSFLATIVSSLVVAAAGGKVVMHTSPTLPPKYGVVLADVLPILGITLDHHAETAYDHLSKIGICALATESFCPPLSRMRKIREELGIRTLWNTVEKALNLGNATYSILGVFHASALEKAAELQKKLGFHRSLVVQGIDGSEDIPLHRASKVCWIDQNNETEEFLINPQEYGLAAEKQLHALTAAEHAEQILAILTNQASPFYDQSILNSGIKLWLCGKSKNLESGIELARSLIRERAAWDVFQSWKEIKDNVT
jgi:anthranilate phosphoribosyltransferase